MYPDRTSRVGRACLPDTVGYGSGGTYGGFDRFGRVVDQKWQNTAGTVKDRYSYTYDRNSNRLARTNGVSSNHSESYTYDGLNRLTGRWLSSWRTENWTLDALGNWGGYSTQGVTPTLHQTREHNAANEIADTTGNQEAINQTEGPAWAEPAYDSAGNMTTGPVPGNETASHSYTYDAWNRLVKVSSGETTVAEYRYDGLNRRIVKLVRQSGSGLWDRTDYYYNQAWQCLEEYVAPSQSSTNKELVATTRQVWYVWDPRYIDAPVVRAYSTDGSGTLDQWLFYCQDANFNTTALVDLASGNVVERYFYDAYGSVTVCGPNFGYTGIIWADSKKNEILYCGYRYDPEAGLYQVRNRYLHPGLGRWINRDPAGYVDGMNLYQYVRSNSVNRSDPHGLMTFYECCSNDAGTGADGKSKRETLIADTKRAHDKIAMLLDIIDQALEEIDHYPPGTERKLRRVQSYLRCADRKLDSLGTKCEAPGQSFTCDGNRNEAWVWPGDLARRIHICPGYWNGPMANNSDNRAATLVHEASHACGTRDGVPWKVESTFWVGWEDSSYIYDVWIVQGFEVPGAY